MSDTTPQPKYEFKTVTAVRGMEARTRTKLEAQGWEFVSQSQKLVQTKLDFRRVKPKTQWWPFAVLGGVLVVCIAILGVMAAFEGGRTPEPTPSPTVAAVKPSETPTPSPTPSETAEVAPVTDAEVVAAFQAFFAERAAAGVVLAKTVSNVSYSDRVVRITFDPAVAGIDQASFDSVLAGWDNLANFAATPVAFNDEIGNRLRPVIASIETFAADGNSLGAYSAAQILALNKIEK